MTIPLDGTGGLFTRLGQIGQLYLATIADLAQAADALGYRVDDIAAQYTSTDQDLISGLYAARDSHRNASSGLFSYLQQLSQNTLIEMANDSYPLPARSLELAIAQLVDEMREASALLDAPAVSAGAVSTASYNVGTGDLIVSVLSNLGGVQNYILDETVRLVCTSDTSTGATKYNETFFVTTPASVPNTDRTWPQGSGLSSSITSINPQADAAQGNLLTNSDFNSFTGNIPDDWTVASGTAGTDFLGGGTGEAYAGDNCLRFAYNAGTGTPELRQQITNIQAATAYTFSCLMKKTASLSGAGAIRIALVDSGGTVLTDPQGNACSTTLTLSGFTTSYVRKTLTTWTPRALPASGGVFLSIKITTAIADSGQSVYVDWGALNLMTQLYTGGPYVSLFSGSTAWRKNDLLECAIDNDYSGQLLHFADRVFDLRNKVFATGSTVPDIPTGSATVSDDLIALTPAYALAAQIAPKNWNNDAPVTDTIDMNLWDEVWFFLMLAPTGAIDSTVAFKLQSDSDSGFGSPSDISGKAISAFGATDDGKAAIIKLKDSEVSERYVRGLATVGNGTTNIITVAAIGVRPRTTPASNIAAVTQVIA